MSLIYNIKGQNGDIKIDLNNIDIKALEDSHGCLVIPIFNKSFIMTYHSQRKGWEFPAGIREEDESIEECARRETFEETGAILDNLIPFGYYVVQNEEKYLKIAVFISNVIKFEPKPRWSETDLVKLFDELPDNISYKDDVYDILIKHLKEKENLINKRP